MRRLPFKLYLISDRRLAGARGLAAVFEAALAEAARLSPTPWLAVQLREKDLDARPLLELALEVGALCRRYGVPMLVNDRVDVALAAGADGVHLPADGIGPADARRLLGPDKLIGVSTHRAEEVEAAAAQGADFALFGPVFAPISKSGYGAATGPEGMAAAARDARIAVLALGGINAERIPMLRATHAAGVALIGAVMGAAEPASAIRELFFALRELES